MDETIADEDLMARYRDGDVTAFDILYSRHRGSLYRYFLRLARPPAVAEELFQDVWMNLIGARGHYEPRAKFATWLYRMAHNRLVDHYRRTAAGVPLSYSDDPDAVSSATMLDPGFREPDREFERRRLSQRLTEVLAALPEAQREAFLLREEGGLSLAEIAGVTGVAAETAKSRLRYAVAKLRHGLSDMKTFDAAAERER